MSSKIKTYEITVSKPHADFRKAETKTFFRNAESLKQLKEKSWLFNSCGIFHAAKATLVNFDSSIKDINDSDF